MKFRLCLGLLLAGLSSLAAESLPGATLEDRMDALSVLGRRTEGSKAEMAAISYILSFCETRGLSPRLEDFTGLPDAFSYSKSIELSFPGNRKERLALLVPLDGHIDGPAGEGNAGIALVLGEIERLSAEIAQGRDLPVGLDFVFLGAENRGRVAEGGNAALGSRLWVEENQGSDPVAVIYLSLDRLSSVLGLKNAGRRILSPFWHYDRSRAALTSSGFAYRLSANRMQIHRIGLVDRTSPLVPYLEAGIPAVEITAEPGATLLPAEAEVRFDAFLEGLLSANAKGLGEEWDRHYLSFQLGNFSLVIREEPYLAFLLSFTALVAAIILFLSVVRRSATKRLLRRLPLQFGHLGLLYSIAAVSFFSTLPFMAFEGLVFGSPEVWRTLPALFTAGRLLASFSLFLAFLCVLVGKKILPADPHFYEFVSFLCLGVDIFVFAALNLPLSFYFVWAFVIVGISLAVRRVLTSLIAYVLMYIPLLLLGADLMVRPELAAFSRLMRPGLEAGLLVVAATLPFYVFTASPLLFFPRRGAPFRARTAFLFLGLAVAIELGLCLLVRGPAASAPLRLREILDQDRGRFDLSLESDGRIGELRLLRGREVLVLHSSGNRLSYDGTEDSKIVGMRSSARSFLDRETRNITLSFTRPPYSVALRLESDSELAIYDCSFPYHVSLDGRSVDIYVGVNPPMPLSFSITASRSLSARLRVESEYIEALEPYAVDGGRPLDLRLSLVTASFPLGEGRN